MSEKIEAFWKDATADDVARVMAGETVEARFRDYDDADWTEFDLLGGFATSISYPVSWFDVCGVRWFQCQVYREPSWYADKPDPGPGFRLLGKFPDEDPQLGDSVFCPGSEIWLELEAPFEPGQRHGLWYRRRIEVEPEPKHYVLRVGDSVETPRGHLIEVVSPHAEQRIYSLDAGDKLTLPNGQTITITAKGFEVTQ